MAQSLRNLQRIKGSVKPSCQQLGWFWKPTPLVPSGVSCCWPDDLDWYAKPARYSTVPAHETSEQAEERQKRVRQAEEAGLQRGESESEWECQGVEPDDFDGWNARKLTVSQAARQAVLWREEREGVYQIVSMNEEEGNKWEWVEVDLSRLILKNQGSAVNYY